MKKRGKTMYSTQLIQRIIALFLAIIGIITTIINGGTTPGGGDEPTSAPEETTDAESVIKDRAAEILAAMTEDEKIGQLFIVAPSSLWSEAGYSYSDTSWNDGMTAALKKRPAGGIILFAANITDPVQISEYTEAMQKASKYPLFIAVDEEGGRVARIGKNPNFDVPHYESMEAVGATGDTANAFNAGKEIGKYVKEYGFNVDFAPVADVNTNPENRVIGNRAFGSDPNEAAKMVGAAIDGFHSSGMITCIKHFPGHGDTKGDTHTGYVSVGKTWEELKNCELIPFAENLTKTDMIMAAHITLPNVSSDGLPASLSKEILTDKLRNEMKYSGVIITDSLGMGAISQHYTSAESALSAFEAGSDIILMPKDYASAFDSIKNAVSDGAVSEQRLNESVTRILELKLKYGIIS